MPLSRCDVTKSSDWDALWSHTESSLGRVTLLVNNAGLALSDRPDSWKPCLDVMLYGVSLGSFKALEKMGRSRGGADGGRIVNIASLAGIMTGLGPINQSLISKSLIVL